MAKVVFLKPAGISTEDPVPSAEPRHWWGNRFVDLIAAVVADALEVPNDDDLGGGVRTLRDGELTPFIIHSKTQRSRYTH